jgi:hypothetical protein
MKLRKEFIVPALVAACSLTACGGGGNLPNGPVVNSPGNGSGNPTKLVNVKVTVTVPRGSKKQVRPDYVSVNTQSLVIQLDSVDGSGVTGVDSTTINTTAHARGCGVGGGSLVCSATASGSPGDDVFAVTTYSGTNATGSVLSVGTVRARVAGGGGNVPISNTLSLTLDGVIASLKLVLAPNWAKRGTPVKADASLAAFDATGAQIIGPSDFSGPVALAIEGDTMHAFSLHAKGKSGSSISIVKPISGITLAYDGKRQASPISVQASVDGSYSIGAKADFALRGKHPPPPPGTIYVLNLGANDGVSATVTEYDGSAKGNAAPERTLQLSSKLYARGIALDAKGNLYVGYLDNSIGFNSGTGQPDTGNEVAIYAPGASGNGQPTAVLQSDPKTKTTLYPIFMSIDPQGRLVTYGATDVDGNDYSSKGAVLTYAAGSSGKAAPAYGFNFASPYLKYNNGGPTGLAIDASNNFYVNGGLDAGFNVDYGLYVAAAADIGNPNAQASRTIPWDSTTELTAGRTSNVSLDASGEIFIGTVAVHGSGSGADCQAEVNVYAAGWNGGVTDVPPVRVLSLDGASTHDCESNPLLGHFPTIDLYALSLYIVDPINDALDAFAASGNGNVKPTVQIAGSLTGLNAPVALVVTSISGPAAAGPVTGASR